ncbi:hypothetical protein L218DRAFT_948562 [Marasmius fiardii PR-910]|nr:hypothetical protein L218DRAFT_948562 [Marasmius fiardii PR-910]
MICFTQITLAAITIFAIVTDVASENTDPIPPNACSSPRSIRCCQSVGNIDEDSDLRKSLGSLVPAGADPFVGLNCGIVSFGADGNLSWIMYKNNLAVDCLPVDP